MEAARPATEADEPRLAELARQGREELAEQRGAEVFLQREAWPPAAAAGRRTVVGTIDAVVVGYAIAHIDDLPDGRRLGVVDELYVEAEARAVGVGEAMMDVVMPWLREAGCIGVDAYALPGMRDTKNFFETFGFTARLLTVHHRFRDE
jgi:GNAT superfamily N-acetyltransferase